MFVILFEFESNKKYKKGEDLYWKESMIYKFSFPIPLFFSDLFGSLC